MNVETIAERSVLGSLRLPWCVDRKQEESERLADLAGRGTEDPDPPEHFSLGK